MTLDLEITIHRSEAAGLNQRLGSVARACGIIHEFLAGTWGIPVPATVTETEIARQFEQCGEYRRDHEQYRILVKRAS